MPAVGHVALYLVFWLVALVVFVVGLALLLHRLRPARVSRALRFLYYIPGALAGAASVMVWLFVLDPRSARWASCCGPWGSTPSARSSPPGTCRSCSP